MKPPVSKPFDPLRIDAMIEPLFVRVEKNRGKIRTMIPLPAGEDGSQQGTNWSKEDVRGLEAWLVNQWSGGGHYIITVTDSTEPTPQKFDWEIFYHPQEYPEKTPPTLAAAAGPDRTAFTPQSQVRSMTSFPSMFPSGFPGGLAQNPVQPQQGPQMVARGDYGRDFGRESFFATQATAQAGAQADAERRRYEEQIREMQAQLARSREEQLAIQHRQDLERAETRMRTEQQAQNERFSKLEQMIAQLATQQARPVVDPAIEQLREQNRILEARAEAERRERETERRERELRDQMQRQAEETRRQIEESRRQMELLTASQNKGLDPLIMMMQENARQQVEAVREQARQASAQMAQMQGFMMNPRDILAMAKESSNGLDQATRSITSTYQSILEMQRNAVEQILQLNNTGGSETIALVKEGLERASSFAERFIGGKTKEAVTAQQAQAQMAQAQAQMAQAQAQALATQASMQAARRSPAAGTNGTATNAQPAAPAVASVAGPSGETRVAQTSSHPVDPAGAVANANDAWTTGPVPPIAPEVKVRRHLGRTDEEWFGPILPRVKELREGVDRFIESLKQDPPRLKEDGHVDGIEPDQAADLVLQAASLVMQQQLPIAAMIDLIGQGRIADFMDVLVPNAPQEYRDEVAQTVLNVLQGGGDDDDDDDEDDEDDDNSDPGAAPSLVKPEPAKPVVRARA